MLTNNELKEVDKIPLYKPVYNATITVVGETNTTRNDNDNNSVIFVPDYNSGGEGGGARLINCQGRLASQSCFSELVVQTWLPVCYPLKSRSWSPLD